MASASSIRSVARCARRQRSPVFSVSRSSSNLASASYTASPAHDGNGHPSTSASSATSSTPLGLTPEQRTSLERMLRVDHSGEIAANTIYIAQARTFRWLGDRQTGALCHEMLQTEKKHLRVTERLLAQHRVRPSLLNPVWSVAGTVLGGVTALLGKEGAMAATEAVETVIGEHYDDQLKLLESIQSASPDVVDEVDRSSLALLQNVIKEFRDDELEHLDTAVEHDAQQAPAHALLSAIIGFGCKGAISIAKRF